MALQQIKDPAELANFTEDQIVRTPGSDKIFIKGSEVDTSAGEDGSLSGTLSSNETDFGNSKLVSKQIAKLASGGAAKRGLDIAKEAGVAPFNPANIRSAINIGGTSNLDIKDIYSATLDRISVQEQNQKDGNSLLSKMIEENPGLWGSLNGDDIDYIKTHGTPHETTLAKMATYRAEHPEEDSNHVLSLRNKYWDAGIDINDTPAQATQKIEANSNIFRKENAPKGDGGEPDFTNTEERKLEQKFGNGWELNTTRQQQLDFLYGSDSLLTDEDLRDASALGISNWSEPAIGTVLESFSNAADRRQFVSDFNLEQEALGALIDPLDFLDEWATKKDAGEFDADNLLLKEFLNEE